MMKGAVVADYIILIVSLCKRHHFSYHHLHHPNLVPLVLCPCFHPSKCSIQACTAAMRWFVNWSLRVAGLPHDIPMLTHCIYLEQGHFGRALHQCACHVDHSGRFFSVTGYLCRRTSTADDLASPDNPSGKNCYQRRVPSRVIVRSIFSMLTGILD